MNGLSVKPCENKVVEKKSLDEISSYLMSHEWSKLKAFRSGGGLRVVRIDSDGLEKCLAYGEHPNLDTAFDHLAEDIRAGGRDYSEVYGVIHENYLTGTHDVSSSLDQWLLQGRGFDFKYVDGQWEFSSEYYYDHPIPDYIQEVCLNDATVIWETDGTKFQTTPSRFPSGTKCTSTKAITNKNYYSKMRKKTIVLQQQFSFDLFYKQVNELVAGIMKENNC